MKKLLIPVFALLIASCNQKNEKKEEQEKVTVGPDLAIRCAKIDILKQLPDPAGTAIEADTVNTINDTLYNIIGHFTTTTDRVGFNCDIALTRDGNSYQMVRIATNP